MGAFINPGADRFAAGGTEEGFGRSFFGRFSQFSAARAGSFAVVEDYLAVGAKPESAFRTTAEAGVEVVAAFGAGHNPDQRVPNQQALDDPGALTLVYRDFFAAFGAVLQARLEVGLAVGAGVWEESVAVGAKVGPGGQLEIAQGTVEVQLDAARRAVVVVFVDFFAAVGADRGLAFRAETIFDVERRPANGANAGVLFFICIFGVFGRSHL
jgi:hypothetical protein